ncbi:MAG TPA: DNA internalization-related competence protein ComEC/Rec2 [Candidatus Acidoferrum sp.]|nr:DNA internalization-related competence protein ComEC/Rec2 [Candidatus Acidoferrum sp.]
MRLSAVAVVAAFACGIALGLHPAVARSASSPGILLTFFCVTAVLILAGITLTRVNRLLSGVTTSLLSWVLLGFLGACIAERPRPAEHVISLVEHGRLDLRTPRRWHGRLRDEPARLPWGHGYEIELSGVEMEGSLQRALGGLRLSFASTPDHPLPPDIHAGDEITVLTEARQPQVFRDDGAFDRRAYLAAQGIDLVATLRAPQLLELESPAVPTIETRLAGVRSRLRAVIDRLFGPTPAVAGVLRAMLLGDRTFVERAEAVDFQKTGVFHVLVVAGLHVGALAFALFWIGRKLRLSPVWIMLFTVTLLFAYVAVVEQRPPVLRAAIMTTMVVLGGFFFRRLDPLNSAAAAALVLLVGRPLALRDSSFQLTFAAIGCIAGLAVPWLEKTIQPYVRALRGWRDVTRDAAHEPRVAQFRIDLRSLAQWISAPLPQRFARMTEDLFTRGLSMAFRAWELLVITVILQIGMLPLMARDFHRIALSGPLANLAVVPLTGVIVPLGFLTLATGLFFSTVGKILALPLAWLTSLVVHSVQWFAHFPRWSYRIPGPPLWLIAFSFLAVALLAVIVRLEHPLRGKIAWGVCVAWLACALVVAIYPFGSHWAKGKLEVTVLDVGQGDSLFVVFPGGKTMLIDGGGAFGGFPGQEQHTGIDPGEEAVSPYLWSRGFQKLDVAALTHAHQDHLGGLTAILDNFRVGRLWIGREVSSTALVRLEDLARQRRVPVEHELRGKSFSRDGVEGSILWPENPIEDVVPSAKNDDSLVLRLKYGRMGILLPGDAEKDAGRGMLSENDADAMQADVLKVAHHGSKNSSTPEFLAAVRPRVGIISSGEGNPYGHPSQELLERLENAGVRILRTDRDGAVHVLTDGTRLEITCFRACLDNANIAASARTENPNHKQDNEKK